MELPFVGMGKLWEKSTGLADQETCLGHVRAEMSSRHPSGDVE